MTNFSDFKKKLQQRSPSELSSAFAAKSYEDDRFWKLPTPSGKEESSAIIRFLPQKDPDKLSFFKYFHFSFLNEATDQYYIENCLNTFGDNVADPCSEENRRLWNLVPPVGADAEYYKNICRKRKRKVGYISNILVVQDKKSPQNNGKVFLFKFGVKILEKINIAAAGNTDLGKVAFDPTSFDDGANFALTMQKDDTGFFQYSKSVFGNQSSIGDDAMQEAIFNKLYDLDTVLEFKDYAQLKERLNLVLGTTNTVVHSDESQHMDTSIDIPHEAIVLPTPATPTAKSSTKKTSPVVIASTTQATDDEDMEFLNQLIND